MEIEGKRFLVARITQYQRKENAPVIVWRHRRHARKIHKMKIPLDQYSPKRLKRKGFVIFSDHDYLDDRVFVRRHGDTLFKAPRIKYIFLRRLRKVYGTCET